MTTRTFSKTDTEADEATALVEHLFRTHHRSLIGYLCAVLREREDAYDITQDTFVDLLLERHKLLQVKNRRAWIYHIALRRAQNWLRRWRRLRWLPWRPLSSEPELIWEGPEISTSRALLIERVVHQLPFKLRNSLTLYYVVGLDTYELSKVLGIGESAARMRLHRARLAFQALYQEEYHHG